VTDKRPDQIFRKTKIISTLGKYTSNLVIKPLFIDSLLGSNLQVDRVRHEHFPHQHEHHLKQRAQGANRDDQEGTEAHKS
jgi:hypothetical protein